MSGQITVWTRDDALPSACKPWPMFKLKNMQRNSALYKKWHGLDELPRADATLVGLYIADEQDSQIKATKQWELKRHVETKKGVKINNVIISYFTPFSCATKLCAPDSPHSSFFDPFTVFFKGKCSDIIGGCVNGTVKGYPKDPLLSETKWQEPLAAMIGRSPIFQDMKDMDVWDNGFVGHKDDIFIYDRWGKLVNYLCLNQIDCNFLGNGKGGRLTVPSGSIMEDEGYKFIRSKLVEALAAKPDRCNGYKPDKKMTPMMKIPFFGAPPDRIEKTRAKVGEPQGETDVFTMCVFVVFGLFICMCVRQRYHKYRHDRAKEVEFGNHIYDQVPSAEDDDREFSMHSKNRT